MAKIAVKLVSSYCNSWPEISIDINGQEFWHGYITEPTAQEFDFEPAESNVLTIKYLNKRCGPEVWDTVLDLDGKIVQDQFCIVTELMLNKAKCDWLIPHLPYQYVTGTSELTNGFMSQQGQFQIEFPKDIFTWIVHRKQELEPQSDKDSSLSYKTIYIPKHENMLCQQLIEEIKENLKRLND